MFNKEQGIAITVNEHMIQGCFKAAFQFGAEVLCVEDIGLSVMPLAQMYLVKLTLGTCIPPTGLAKDLQLAFR
jgi:hypothetical protein